MASKKERANSCGEKENGEVQGGLWVVLQVDGKYWRSAGVEKKVVAG